MLISSQFNRFMHGVVLGEILRLRRLEFAVFDKRYKIEPFYIGKEATKRLLKLFDLDYPRKADGTPISYCDLSVSDMLSHLAFIESTLAFNGVKVKFNQTQLYTYF